jgi:hypothetical protein
MQDYVIFGLNEDEIPIDHVKKLNGLYFTKDL